MKQRNNKQIQNRIQIQKEFKNGFNKLVNLEVFNVFEDLNYLQNISLSIDGSITDVLETKLLSYIKDDDLREFIKDGLNNSNIYELYDIDDRKYLNIVKLIVEEFKEDNMNEINIFKDEFYKDIKEDELEYIENYPQLEIQLDINDEYNKPYTLFGERLCYQDDSIFPSDSIMVYINI